MVTCNESTHNKSISVSYVIVIVLQNSLGNEKSMIMTSSQTEAEPNTNVILSNRCYLRNLLVSDPWNTERFKINQFKFVKSHYILS